MLQAAANVAALSNSYIWGQFLFLQVSYLGMDEYAGRRCGMKGVGENDDVSTVARLD
jgi:hypothetical protein